MGAIDSLRYGLSVSSKTDQQCDFPSHLHSTGTMYLGCVVFVLSGQDKVRGADGDPQRV
jgi:hypothetical protein